MNRWMGWLVAFVLITCASPALTDEPVVPADAERLTGERIADFLAGKYLPVCRF